MSQTNQNKFQIHEKSDSIIAKKYEKMNNNNVKMILNHTNSKFQTQTTNRENSSSSNHQACKYFLALFN